MSEVTSSEIKLALLSYYRYKRQQVAADEVGFCLGNTDISVFDDGRLIEIEIKTSKSDLWQGEKRKASKHQIYKNPTPEALKKYIVPNQFFICVPTTLLDTAKDWVLTTHEKYGILIYDSKKSFAPEDSISIHKRAKDLHSEQATQTVLKKIARRLSSAVIVLRAQMLRQANVVPETKVCSKCKETKFLVEFHKAQTGADGHRNDCKRCVKLKFLKYCKENPWYKIFYNIKNRCENPDAIDYQWYGGKGIKCLLTKDEIKELWFRDKAYEMKKPSIDRQRSNLHYTRDNCHFIEHNLNCSQAMIERWEKEKGA